MRNEHCELIREEMKESNKYTHDIHSLSIADIFSLIQYHKNILSELKNTPTFLSKERFEKNLEELEEYILEYSGRLSNRTINR